MFNRKSKNGTNHSSSSYGAIDAVEPEVAEPEVTEVKDVSDEGVAQSRPRYHNAIGNFVVKDHFSLSNPTSAVKFIDDETLIFTDNSEQITLEKKKDDDFVTAKQATISSPGLSFLRLAYTTVTVFMTGLLFVFCVQLVLFLFLGLAIESGLTSNTADLNFWAFLGTFFAIPVFVYGLSQIMTIANTFIIDTFKGSKFMKTIISWDSVLIDWLSFFVFFGGPVVVASVTLFLGMREWWTITSITWFSLVVLYFIVFAISTVYYEVDGCLELIAYHKNFRLEGDTDDDRSIRTFRRAIALRLKQILSGYELVTYTATGSDKTPDTTEFGEVLMKASLERHMGPYSWVTMQKFADFFFDPLETPKRQFSVDDVLEFTPYVTNNTWGLESIYCRDRETRFIAIINGESALTPQQVKSSLACFILGSVMTLGAIVGFLHFMGVSAQGLIIVAILFCASSYQSIKSQIGLNSAYTHVLSRDEDINRDKRSDALYQVQELYRVSEPRVEMYWLFLIVSVVCFQIIPIYGLFSAGNTRIGLIFIFMSLVAVLRAVCSAPACLQELGSLDGMELNNETPDARAEWREKHRLGKIVTEISVGKRSRFWQGFFIMTVCIFCAIFVSAMVLGADAGISDPVAFAGKHDFVYEGSQSLNYASCSLTESIKSPDGQKNSMVDFAFLSTIAYMDDESSLAAAREWFEADVNNLVTTVSDFKTDYQEKTGSSSVMYKLFEFPANDLKIVAVRGTANSWDTLTDAQLWDGAMFSQVVRSMLPFGKSLWDPLLPYLVKGISLIEDSTLKEVAYYRETTAFVNHLKTKFGYDVEIVGHSLGGGLAMITGAQTQTPSVGLSGPNARLSRFAFHPQISIDALDKYTFNIVPDRDPVPRIDDLDKNYQRIACRAPPNSPVDCHYGKRSLCEIIYTCGSGGRPIPCYCHNEYGYPAPTSINGTSYSDVCPMEE